MEIQVDGVQIENYIAGSLTTSAISTGPPAPGSRRSAARWRPSSPARRW